MDYTPVLYLIGFAFYFLVNAAISALAGKRVAKLALVASVCSPFALLMYLILQDASKHGLATTLDDPKLVVLLVEIAIPLAVCAALGAKAAQMVVTRVRNRGMPT